MNTLRSLVAVVLLLALMLGGVNSQHVLAQNGATCDFQVGQMITVRAETEMMSMPSDDRNNHVGTLANGTTFMAAAVQSAQDGCWYQTGPGGSWVKLFQQQLPQQIVQSDACGVLVAAGAPVQNWSAQQCADVVNAWISGQLASKFNIFNPFPLHGHFYRAYGSNQELPLYATTVEADGTYWQPQLPPQGQRESFFTSIELPAGNYTFSGVSCDLHVDAAHNGGGLNNPLTAGRGNALPFSVVAPIGTNDPNWVAWAAVQCGAPGQNNDVVGSSIKPAA